MIDWLFFLHLCVVKFGSESESKPNEREREIWRNLIVNHLTNKIVQYAKNKKWIELNKQTFIEKARERKEEKKRNI
jgi:hypothetical protein